MKYFCVRLIPVLQCVLSFILLICTLHILILDRYKCASDAVVITIVLRCVVCELIKCVSVKSIATAVFLALLPAWWQHAACKSGTL